MPGPVHTRWASECRGLGASGYFSGNGDPSSVASHPTPDLSRRSLVVGRSSVASRCRTPTNLRSPKRVRRVRGKRPGGQSLRYHADFGAAPEGNNTTPASPADTGIDTKRRRKTWRLINHPSPGARSPSRACVGTTRRPEQSQPGHPAKDPTTKWPSLVRFSCRPQSAFFSVIPPVPPKPKWDLPAVASRGGSPQTAVVNAVFGQRLPTEERLFAYGLSRWTTFTRYPALRRCLLTSSAIITLRC